MSRLRLPDDSSGTIMTSLANLPKATFLDEFALAGALKVSQRTVRRMVVRREIPPSLRLGGRSVWQVGRVLAWLNARCEQAERMSGVTFLALTGRRENEQEDVSAPGDGRLDDHGSRPMPA